MNGLEQISVSLIRTVSDHPQRWLAWASAATFVIALVCDWLPKPRMEKAKRPSPPPLPTRR
jgi:hypothetical protein